MRLNLSELSLRGAALDLGSIAAETEGQHVNVRDAERVAGSLRTGGGSMHLDDVTAERVCLESSSLLFGSVRLDAGQDTRLLDVEAEMERAHDAPMRLQVRARKLTTPHFQVRVGTIEVVFGATLEGVELSVHGGEGRVTARQAEFRGFRFGLETTQILASELRAGPVEIGWGVQGFQLRAEEVVAPLLDVGLSGTVVRAHRVAAERLLVHDSDISLQSLRAERGEARLGFGAPATQVHATPAKMPEISGESQATAEGIAAEEAAEGEPVAPPATSEAASNGKLPVFDWGLLDNISGRLHVDVGMVLKLPFLRRRAVHELRVGIDRGALDFRRLQQDLSGLEGALLDFSVRGRHLVLELGLPFLPTRGRGRPLVEWELPPDERKLAEGNKVRLARLARPNVLVGKPEASGEIVGSDTSSADSPSGANGASPLRELSLKNISIDLSAEKHEQDMEALLRSFSAGQLQVSGDVVHRAGDVAGSRIRASVRRVQFDLDDFPIGERLFDVRDVDIARIPSVEVHFQGARPERCELRLEGFSSRRIDLGRFAIDDGQGS